ncbi:ABC transporter permease [Spiractinospora alimapuensis]|uniref:ABC transporter permease n=1 Tax=Spiractinospora alimapuensis TaxID=2820884 RepID=UPI001F3E4DC3|nr:ABC transporter permease [Spiractinospora alimapuensis]QVQ52771.1 ABC transporter permease [Spiractinospora alimapuensis]
MIDRARAILLTAGSRLLSALVVMFLAATVTFLLVRISGDPLALLLPPDATQEQADELAATLGLDQPLAVQYVEYLAGLARFDLGDSLFYNQPVLTVIAERLPATALLATSALAIALLLAVPTGIMAAMRRGTAGDKGVMAVILVGQSTPPFWIGIVLVLVFAVQLQVLPAAGYGSAANLLLPAVTLAIYSVAVIARLLRSSLIDVLSADYMRTATAKGYGPTHGVLAHGLRNASLPVVTVVGLETGTLLSGAILTEQVFGWPGLGSLTVEAISNRDLPLVQGTVLLFALIFVVINILVDLSYSILDPRVRTEKR